MPTGVEDAYNLEVTSRFPRTILPLFTSCAAGILAPQPVLVMLVMEAIIDRQGQLPMNQIF